MAKKRSDCELYKHRNGQWSKRVRSKLYYFGTDKDEALKRWAVEGPYLRAGLEPPRDDGSPTLSELANAYLARCRDLVAQGEMSQRSVNDAITTLGRLAKLRGRDCHPSQWTPADFFAIKKALAEPVERDAEVVAKGLKGRAVEQRAPETVAGDIRRIKAWLNWCSADDVGHIPKPKYGRDFMVSRKTLQRARLAKGRLDIEPVDLRAILTKCSPRLRPIVLLGINAGMGAKDLADLKLADWPKMEGDVFITSPRGKTLGYRRFWLWPETVAAIKQYLEKRPKPADESVSGLLFLTSQGHAWLTEVDGKRKDSIGWGFSQARKRAGVLRGTFYDLRRTFETVANATLDQAAVNVVMGHVPPADDMASRYLQYVSDDRLRAVCQHVRTWLALDDLR